MKKYFAIVGLALVILVGYFFTNVMSDQKSVYEMAAETYLTYNYGYDDYEIDISKVEDDTVYFYYDGDRYSGYTHVSINNRNS